MYSSMMAGVQGRQPPALFFYLNVLFNDALVNIKPCSAKIAKVAYNNYDKYISYDIKSIKPNYIKPIDFKTNN